MQRNQIKLMVDIIKHSGGQKIMGYHIQGAVRKEKVNQVAYIQ